VVTLALLPTRPTVDESAVYVERIIEMYAMATEEQIEAGVGWYPAAHLIAEEFGDARRGAGILAALSANKGWSDNVRLARQAFRGELGGHFADALAKCRAILDGQDPAEVLPMSIKTGQFFLCIADPADPEAVVIDRHAHDIVAGMKFGHQHRGLGNISRYTSIADAHRQAAKRLGMVASQLQAIVWTVVTDIGRNSRKLTGVPGWGTKGDDDE